MKDTLDVTDIYRFIRWHNQAFTRQTIYDDIDSGILRPIRNPRKRQGQYQFSFADAGVYIDETLNWDKGRAEKELRIQQIPSSKGGK